MSQVELESFDFKVLRLNDRDAIRIKQSKIPEGHKSKKVWTFYGSKAKRRDNKHEYFSARA